jgi:hypothetical protein
MPFEISTQPEDFPLASGLYKCSPRHALFHFLSRFSPARSYLQDLDTLPREAKPQVQLRSDVRRWPPLFDEPCDGSLDALPLELSQSHCSDT